MEIYLCKVAEKDGARFLKRKPHGTTDDSYIAVSHVWGTPETISQVHVDGVGDVSLSPGKKDILAILQRPDICGQSWFWMDLFCIDQTPNASISISDQLLAIPQIYKSSRCVKVLIETPICRTWHENAITTDAFQVWCSTTWKADEKLATEKAENFEAWESIHARKCPCMLYHDAWFDWLWTRQEGLYAATLDFVPLNMVNCLRYEIAQSNERKWVAQGDNRKRRERVLTFIADKLEYHGALCREENRTAAYFKMMYQHRLGIDQFDEKIGPVDGYSPIDEAWRSSRITTKPRDYVLAIFPDIKGYRIPPNARGLAFRQLLLDAIVQLGRESSSPIVFKVLNSLVNSEDDDHSGAVPFLLEQPDSISEAFDTFAVLDSEPRDAKNPTYSVESDSEIVTISASLRLETVHMTPDQLPAMVDLWKASANNLSQYLSACLSGPCLGTSWGIEAENLAFRSLAFQFGKVRIDEWASTQPKYKIPSNPDGITDWDDLREVRGDAECAVFLRRFMVCLMCGCSLRTADYLLMKADFRTVETPFGKQLALVNKNAISLEVNNKFLLVNRGLLDFEGFHIGIRKTTDLAIDSLERPGYQRDQ